MGKFEFYASIPGDSTCANSENFNLGLKIWEDWEYLNSSCNSCKVISVSISYRVLIKDQMFTHIEFNWVWEEVKSYSAINQNQTNTMQFGTSLRHWQVEAGKIKCTQLGGPNLTQPAIRQKIDNKIHHQPTGIFRLICFELKPKFLFWVLL